MARQSCRYLFLCCVLMLWLPLMSKRRFEKNRTYKRIKLLSRLCRLPPTHFWTFRHRIPLSSDLCFRKASEFRLSLVLFMHNNLSHVDSSTALPEGLLQDLPQLMRQPYLMNIPVGKVRVCFQTDAHIYRF